MKGKCPHCGGPMGGDDASSMAKPNAFKEAASGGGGKGMPHGAGHMPIVIMMHMGQGHEPKGKGKLGKVFPDDAAASGPPRGSKDKDAM